MNDSQPFFRLVVKFKDYSNLLNSEEISQSLLQSDLLSFEGLLDIFKDLKFGKLFSSLESEQIVDLVTRAGKLDPDYKSPDFLAYHTIDCPYEKYSSQILKILLDHNKIEKAYIETSSSIPPSNADINYQSFIHQGYLNPAPVGIDAVYCWSKQGGDGEGQVKFIDIEQGWNLDSGLFSVKTLPSTGMNFPVFKNHGEAVLGVILTKDNFGGSKGIAPNANGYVISQWRPDGSFNTADAIMAAIGQLDYGDIILLEAQIYDPPDGENLFPVEIQDAVFDVIRLASTLGITVIEAAGNGQRSFGAGNDLDNYTNSNGKYPLNRSTPDFRDSGAILVAAASDAVPHTKIRHSNFGSRIDCYAWGERVSTAGSHQGSSEMAIHSYSKKINGTSSAAAIIAGAAIIVQNIAESCHHFRLGPNHMRQILGNDLLATASANGRIIDKIGVMPDMKRIVDFINLI